MAIDVFLGLPETGDPDDIRLVDFVVSSQSDLSGGVTLSLDTSSAFLAVNTALAGNVLLTLNALDTQRVAAQLSGAVDLTLQVLDGAIDIRLQPIFEILPVDSLVWIDITDSVVDNDINVSYGIQGNGPLDLVARSGQCTFTLRNDSFNGKPMGYYSPNHPSVRTGWTFGIPFRLSGRIVNHTYPIFRGKIGSITPDTGQYGRRQVSVVAYDIMRDLAEADVKNIAIQINQTETQVIANVFSSLNATQQPVATQIDTGVDTLPYVLDNLGASTKALTVINDVATSSLTSIFSIYDGTVIVRNRQNRTNVATSRYRFDNDFNNLVIPSDLNGVYNHARITIHPRSVDANPTTVLYALTGTPPQIPANSTVTLWGTYSDSANAQKLIGATAVVTSLVSGTDYAGNSAVDGSGSNQNAALSIVATAFATTVKFDVSNTTGAPVYLIATGGSGPKLQIRGKGVYDRGPQVYESFLAHPYGDRIIDANLVYQSDPFVAQSLAIYIRAQYEGFVRQVKEITYVGNRSFSKMILSMTAKPGDQITVSDKVTGVQDVNCVIQSITHHIKERNITTTFGLAPASIFTFWLWDIPGRSEWGDTTVYGL